MIAALRLVPPWCWALLLTVSAVLGAELHGRHVGNVQGRAEVQAKWDADKLKQTQAALAKDAEYRARERAWSKQLEDAQNEAAQRQQTIQRDADAARAAADGLRDQLANTKRQLSTASADAVRQYADALADVFSQCAARYTRLARDADACESDKQTLMQAWPK